MIASIFDADEVADDFRDLIAERTEGNPFVVEEMLREAVERGDVPRGGGWERRASKSSGSRRPCARRSCCGSAGSTTSHDVLRAAAVLGRTFLPDAGRRFGHG